MPHLRTPMQKGAAALCLAISSTLVGCSVGVQDAVVNAGDAVSTASPAFHLHGNVHGGAFPIQQATITLMATASNGYGGAATSLASTSSDQYGNFTFNTVNACPAGQYAYIVVTGGHTLSTTSNNNNNVIQLGVIGSCSSYLNATEIANVEVYVSELSTIAAAYALANFITITGAPAAVNVSGGQIVNISAPANNNSAAGTCKGPGNPKNTATAMSCTAAGLAHGFDNAYNLVDSVRYDGSFPTGEARATTPGNTQGIVPQALINTMGNVLQDCVDSTGGAVVGTTSATYKSDGTFCGNLFFGAIPTVGMVPSDGTRPTYGTPPTNTLQVALNMAKQPTNNVTGLFNMQARAAFFSPSMTTSPGNFAISIFYTGLTNNNATYTLKTPVDVALDANDEAYVLQSVAGGEGTVTSFMANGASNFSGSYFPAINPSAIALDYGTTAAVAPSTVPTPNVWVTDDAANTTTAFSGSCTASLAGCLWELSGTTGGATNGITVPAGSPSGVAVDQSNNVWISRDATTGQSLYRFTATTNYASTIFAATPTIAASNNRIVIDSDQDVWGVTTSGTAKTFEYDYGLSVLRTLTAGVTTKTLNTTGAFGIAVSNGLTAYVPLNGQIDTSTVLGCSCGDFTYPTTGTYAGTASTSPNAVALDGNGMVFWTDTVANEVFALQPSSTGNVTSSGSTTPVMMAFAPCYLPLNATACSNTSVTGLRSMAIDSSGALWYLSSGGKLAIQTLGLAANSWPLLAYAETATKVQ